MIMKIIALVQLLFLFCLDNYYYMYLKKKKVLL